MPRAARSIRTLLGIALALLAGLGLLLVVVTTTPLVSWWATALAGPWNDPGGDVLIVLGGGLLAPGVMGSSSYWRDAYAWLAWQEGTFREIVLSGGPPGSSVADAMAEYLACRGVPRAALRIEARSRSTRENALHVKALLDGTAGSKVLLTSDYHMFRATRAFRKAGLDVIPRPFPDIRKRAQSWEGRWPAFLDLVRETVKIGYYYVRGWI